MLRRQMAAAVVKQDWFI